MEMYEIAFKNQYIKNNLECFLKVYFLRKSFKFPLLYFQNQTGWMAVCIRDPQRV